MFVFTLLYEVSIFFCFSKHAQTEALYFGTELASLVFSLTSHWVKASRAALKGSNFKPLPQLCFNL